MSRTARPWLSQSVDRGVHFRFGDDVDAACRFIEDKDLRLRHKGPADDNLLLVAAGKRGDFLRRGGYAHGKLLEEALYGIALGSAADETEFAYSLQRAQGHVFAD